MAQEGVGSGSSDKKNDKAPADVKSPKAASSRGEQQQDFQTREQLHL